MEFNTIRPNKMKAPQTLRGYLTILKTIGQWSSSQFKGYENLSDNQKVAIGMFEAEIDDLIGYLVDDTYSAFSN